MKRSHIIFFISLCALLSFVSCEKEITVDLPKVEPKIVIEATIISEQQPLVMLTWSQGYFDPTDLSSLQNMFVHDAEVSISDGTTEYPLEEICTNELTPEQLEFAAQFLGLSVEEIQAYNLCIYTNFTLMGQPGTVYHLKVDYQNHHLTSTTRLPELVYLSNVYFNVISTLPDDSLGFIFGSIADPDTIGNAYRWFAKRINKYPNWVPDEELRGRQKDMGFIAPIGSVIDDAFFNGLEFEFGYYRGTTPNTTKFDDLNGERGFFKRGDTVAVRGTVVDRNSYKFLYSLETLVSNQGSPFSVPANLESNVKGGGLGAFIGYGAVYDTVICQ